MALFDRFGWGKRARRLSVKQKAWWETAGELHPETLYGPASDFGSDGDFDQDEGFDYDPTGSYTGVPEDGGEPVQDADDL